MTELRITVSGPLSSIATLREQMEADKIDGVELTNIVEKSLDDDDPLATNPLGMEPLTYFIVVFAAHLSASVVHDWVKEKIKKGGHNVVSTDQK